MAIKTGFNPKEKATGMGTLFGRAMAQPLDVSEVFESISDAKLYAGGTSTGIGNDSRQLGGAVFAGQELSIVEYDNLTTSYTTHRAVVTMNNNNGVLDPIVTVDTAWETWKPTVQITCANIAELTPEIDIIAANGTPITGVIDATIDSKVIININFNNGSSKRFSSASITSGTGVTITDASTAGVQRASFVLNVAANATATTFSIAMQNKPAS